MSEYEARYPDKIHREDAPAHQAGYPDEVRKAAAQTEKKPAMAAQKPRLPGKKAPAPEENDRKVIDNGPSAPYSDVNKLKPALTQTEQSIVDALGPEPRLVDDVIAETGLGTGKVLSLLTLLEIRGVVKRHPGKRISLK